VGELERIKQMRKEDLPNYFIEQKEKENQLLTNIKAKLPELETFFRGN
jgi:hypothetical protein